MGFFNKKEKLIILTKNEYENRIKYAKQEGYIEGYNIGYKEGSLKLPFAVKETIRCLKKVLEDVYYEIKIYDDEEGVHMYDNGSKYIYPKYNERHIRLEHKEFTFISSKHISDTIKSLLGK